MSAPTAAYFDTNIIRDGGWPEPSARLLEVLHKAERVGVVPCLVSLVRDELVEGLIRDLGAEHNDLVKDGTKFARRTLGLVKVALPGPLPPVAEMRAHIAKQTEKLLGTFRAVPNTRQSTGYFTKLAINRGGAFVEGGKGFNDTVILVSVIEDMEREGIASALLLSEDKGFKGEGMRQVVGNKRLQVVTSLDAFDKLLDRLLSDQVHAYMTERKQRLLAAIEAHREQLTNFLRQNLSLTAQELGTVDKVRRVELVEVIKLEDAHSVPLILGQESREDNQLSVDVRIRVRFETAGFIFERSHPRDQVLPLPTDYFVAEREKEVIVTVEGTAEVTDQGIQAVKFLRVSGRKERGFGALLGSLT